MVEQAQADRFRISWSGG